MRERKQKQVDGAMSVVIMVLIASPAFDRRALKTLAA